MNDKIFINSEINLVVLYQKMKKYYIFSLKCIVVFLCLGIIYIFVATPLYKSELTIYPSVNDTTTSGMMGDILDIATNVGIELGNSTMASFSILDIIDSRTVKLNLINSFYAANDFSDKINLIKYWEINKPSFFGNFIYKIKSIINNSEIDHKLIWEKVAIEELNDRIAVYEEESGLIRINVYMEESGMSVQVADNLYDFIIDYTTKVQNESAKLNKEFILTRIRDKKKDLENTEEKLKLFRENNRSIQDSPQLQLERERLLRDVEINTEVFTTLNQQYEISRIEEKKQTPSIIILDNPIPSVKKDKPNNSSVLFVSLILGYLYSLFIIIYRNLKNTK